MGFFSSKSSGSSNGRSTRNSSAHGHPPISEKRARQARAEKWDNIAAQKRSKFGKDSAEYKEAKDQAKRAWRNV